MPLIVVPIPLSVTAPLPINDPFTTRFPETPRVDVEASSIAPLLMVRLVIVEAIESVTEFPDVVAITASSVERGATPPTQVVPVDQSPPVVVLVMMAACVSLSGIKKVAVKNNRPSTRAMFRKNAIEGIEKRSGPPVQRRSFEKKGRLRYLKFDIF
ncbi:MAG: hypothetical protein HY283_05920 [Nitrospirae bacterium]|nr:hypothetical protein [Nitrospirota bacterium]